MKKHCSEQAGIPPILPQLTRLYLLALCILLPLLPCIGGYQALGERTYRLFYLLTIGYLAALAIICLELAFVGKCTLRALLAPLWRRSRSKLFLLLFLGGPSSPRFSRHLREPGSVWDSTAAYSPHCCMACCS